ncbi:MAG: glycosyltransferase [Thermodesulfobacteriota bacterium]
MLKPDTPLFSVIIPTYNRRYLFETALKSVLNQTYMDFEVIVVDDGSTDQTSEVIQNFVDARIKYLHQENHGVSHARNRGLEISKGKFMAFLDSDDRWVPQKLRRAKESIDRYPDICIFHTDEIWYKGGTLLNQMKKHKKPSGYVYLKALPLCCIGMSTSVVKREVFETIGVFDESLPACEDYDFWLRATHSFEVKLINENLTIKDGGRRDQLSSQWGLDKHRIKALEKMLCSNNLNVEEYRFTCGELVKKCRIYASGAEKRGRQEEANLYNELARKYPFENEG